MACMLIMLHLNIDSCTAKLKVMMKVLKKNQYLKKLPTVGLTTTENGASWADWNGLGNLNGGISDGVVAVSLLHKGHISGGSRYKMLTPFWQCWNNSIGSGSSILISVSLVVSRWYQLRGFKVKGKQLLWRCRNKCQFFLFLWKCCSIAEIIINDKLRNIHHQNRV